MNVLVTGGGTSAPIDDVRTISNLSTGRFAAAISESLVARGACVWHLHTPTAQLPFLRLAQFDLESRDPAAEFERLRCLHNDWKSARERLHLVSLKTGTVSDYSAILKHILLTQPIDVAILAMAVSDYEPVPTEGKLSSRESELVIRCVQTPKVIRSVREWAPHVYLVGFKLLSRVSTAELVRQAEAAGRATGADLTVANDLQSLLAGSHTVHLVRAGQPPATLEPGADLADRLVEQILAWAAAGRAT